jgi:hypothetical protein
VFEIRENDKGRTRLGNVVVGTEIKAGDAVHIVATGTKHSQWHHTKAANSLKYLDTIRARDHDIEDKNVVVASFAFLDAVPTILHTTDFEPLFCQIL